VLPGVRVGDPAVLTVEPDVVLDRFGHEITTAPAQVKPDFAVVRRPGTDFILVRGMVPVGHESIRVDFALTDPATAAALALAESLEAHGVRVNGSVRVKHAPPPDTSDLGDLPPPAETPPPSAPLVLAEHLSQPLLEGVRVTNKASHNLHAELLLRTSARERTGIGSAVQALKLEQDFLRQAGIGDGDVVLSDGSGLSHEDLVTPRAIVQLLRYAAQQPWGAGYVSTFPIAGVDGTLEGRMKGTGAAGAVRAKTGGLEHVHALAGYANTLAGAPLVFAIFENNSTTKGHDATAAIDAITVAMVETLGVPKAKPESKAKKKK
jgi:serine-type D-Ala-D-Ala carboxypeptidase/endopeptidase (penicillin-binding protein 4)